MRSGSQPRERQRVLVIDDDHAIREIVHRALEGEGYRVEEAETGADGLEALSSRPPALVILDLGLPDVSGIEVLTTLRASGDIPVLVLTGRGEEADRVAALELGADDYVVKPFFARELAARVRAVLRRGPAEGTSERLVFPGLEIDRRSRDVTVRGEVVELTTKEFDLLVELATHPRRVISREELLRSVWRSSAEWQTADTVTEHVRRARRKIEPNPEEPTLIRTIRGVGYRFEPPEQD